MSAWTAECTVAAVVYTKVHDYWHDARSALVDMVQQHATPAVRPTLYNLAGDAEPGKEWSAVGGGMRLALRQVGATPAPAPDATPAHADREHSELGASICERWWNCPGSVAASRGAPDRSTPAAQLGTAAHEVAELCLRNGQDAIEYVGRIVNGIEIDAHTADKVQVYLDDCRAYDGPDEFAWTEVRFTLAALNPPAPMFGTADRVEYFPDARLLRVKDYKNGYVRVPVAHNPQLKYYALGAVLKLGADYPVSTVEVTICQPEHGEPQRFEYDAVDLAEWSAELIERARAATAPDASRHAGPWCKYCPAAGGCAAQASRNLALAQQEFGAESALPDPATLPPAQRAEILNRADEFTGWLDAVRAYSKQAADVPGWKVVATFGHAAWRSDAEAAELFETVHEIDPWEPRKIASPAEIRRRLTDAAYRPALAAWDAAGRPKGAKPLKKDAEENARGQIAPLTFRRATGTALVPEADKRPAVPVGAAQEFGAIAAPGAANESTETE